MIPEQLKYTKEHEWIRLESDGNIGVIGITHFAQEQLGDVVFVELPEVGKHFKRGEDLGVVESVKTVSDIFCPVDGKVVEINHNLENMPEIVNQDPYEKGWFLKIEVVSPQTIDDLLDHKAYKKLIENH